MQTEEIMVTLSFTKAVGTGNDFVIIDTRLTPITLTTDQICLLAHRHSGIGCDQVILVCPPATAKSQALLRFYNADGSEAGACGNGTRCVAHLLMEQQNRQKIYLECADKLYHAKRGGGESICVSMGQPKFSWHEIPLSHESALDNVLYEGKPPICVNIGNPHAVFSVKYADKVVLSEAGPPLENHSAFPERVNVVFMEIMDRHTLRLRVWERGSGLTLACGTGACAAAVAAIRSGLVDSQALNPVKVIQSGGECFVHWEKGKDILLTGLANITFKGTVNLE